MLTTQTIHNVMRFRRQMGETYLPAPRDHCPPEYYSRKRFEELQRERARESTLEKEANRATYARVMQNHFYLTERNYL